MAEESKSDSEKGNQSDSTGGGDQPSQSGDPGRTPSSAEGDRETVEEDLRDKDIEE